MEQMNAEELQVLMKKIEKENAAQKRYAMIQCFFSGVSCVLMALFLVTVLGCALYVGPKTVDMMKKADAVLNETESMVADSKVIISNMEKITSDLAQADIPTMLTDVNQLVADSQTGMQEAIQKIEAIDIETMNRAITDLSNVIAPLAKLFGGGKK